MATASQLKALRKKHHLGEFSHTRTKPRKAYSTMARKGKFRKAYRAASRETPTNLAIGAALYGAVGENLADQLTGQINIGVSTDLIKGLAGYYLSQKTTGIFKGMFLGMLSVSAYKVGKTGLAGLGIGNSTSSGSDF